jgi:hypothetical protein
MSLHDIPAHPLSEPSMHSVDTASVAALEVAAPSEATTSQVQVSFQPTSTPSTKLLVAESVASV